MAEAYFLTFTTYGTRLHGSVKGSVDDLHRGFGAPFVKPNPARERREREAMVQPPYELGAGARDLVCKAILGLAAERGWRVLAAHVRITHVHVVIQTNADRDPGRTLSDLKARASRNLTRAGFDDQGRRRWSRHGSTQHLFEPSQIEAAIRYTLDEQGAPMSCYDPRPSSDTAAQQDKEPRTK